MNEWVPLNRRRNRPSYCLTVRLGLDTIARRTKPVDQFETAALRWIAEMKWWHEHVFRPKKRLGEHKQKLKKESRK